MKSKFCHEVSMKRILSLLLLVCANNLGAAEPSPSEQWWSYLASYDAGPVYLVELSAAQAGSFG